MKHHLQEFIDKARAHASDIPEHLRGGALRYVEEGITPGGFLCAVIDNDLAEAVLRQHPTDTDALHAVVLWLHNYAPATCHGSREKRLMWVASFLEVSL